MASSTQSYENHRRFVPLYHQVLFACLLVNLGWAIYRIVHAFSGDNLVNLILAFALFLLAFFSRAFALRAQDRVIRLEMRLRLADLLPADLQPRIREFTPAQLIALRFASDRELPGLAATVLKDNVRGGNDIKKMIKEWHPDDLRV